MLIGRIDQHKNGICVFDAEGQLLFCHVGTLVEFRNDQILLRDKDRFLALNPWGLCEDASDLAYRGPQSTFQEASDLLPRDTSLKQ